MRKRLLLFTILTAFVSTSCKSEYEERLEKARAIKYEMERLTQVGHEMGLEMNSEINELESEIQFHSKVSGNPELFLKELFN